MKKIYLMLLFLLGVCVQISSVEAKCTYNEKVKLQKLAGNVLFSYDYIESDYGVTFDITVSNLTDYLYMVDRTTGKSYRAHNQDVVIPGYQSGSTIQFDFYAVNEECGNEKEPIFTNYVTLPSFNPFYKEQICEGASEYKLCQKWIKIDVGYTDFYKLVYQYKQTKTDSVIEEEDVDDKVIGEAFLDFWEKYYFYILGGILLFSLLGIYFYNRSLRM